MAELEVENGYVMQGLQEGPPIDGVRDNEQERGVEGEATSCNMDLDNQLTQEQLHSTLMVVDDSRRFSVGLISNGFDANEFQWEEQEQEEEDMIGEQLAVI